MTALIVSNKVLDYIMKIIKRLEESGVSKTIKNEAKQKNKKRDKMIFKRQQVFSSKSRLTSLSAEVYKIRWR